MINADLPDSLTRQNPPLPTALTMGDAAGIGPEIIVKCFRDDPRAMRGTFVAGDVATMRRAAQVVATAAGQLALPVARIAAPDEAWTVPPNCIAVLQVGEPLAAVEWGQISALAGAYSGQCVLWAAASALRQELAAIVTAPLHKEALHAAGAPFAQFAGHTEMLQDCAARHAGVNADQLPVRMMLANTELRTVLVSIHMSLRSAVLAVTASNVLETLQITDQALGQVLGRRPRIAVAGLNPHAGEGGLFGREELDIIAPAIETARQNGCHVHGPFAPDTIFMKARARPGFVPEFDVVVAMYHDQGLIPVKYLGVEDGVNVTLGLPFVRTSPDHGPAFDIAGTGQASAQSMLQAVRMAQALNFPRPVSYNGQNPPSSDVH